MKILHVNASQVGGAAICAMRIMKAEKELGHECRMLTIEGGADADFQDEDIIVLEEDSDFLKGFFIGRMIKKILRVLPGYWNLEKMERVFRLATQNIETVPYVHFPLTKYKNIAYHEFFEWADIIHLHWVSGMIDYPSFFSKINKPIVWTLHDEHPARGLMHFQSSFSPLPDSLHDLNDRCALIKQTSLEKICNCYLVALSEYMEHVIKQSPILNRFPVIKIHNGLDTKTFKPFDRCVVRRELNIPEDTKVFLFSSFHVFDSRKGLDRVICAFEKLKIQNFQIVCVGFKPEQSDDPLNHIPIRFLGLISSQTHLAKIYSAADYFINASYQEAFAQTPLEAMACGIPVISTPCSGAKDLIRDFNGVVCDDFSSDAIAKAIFQATQRQYDPQIIRNHITTFFDDSVIAKQYEKCYYETLNHNHKL